VLSLSVIELLENIFKIPTDRTRMRTFNLFRLRRSREAFALSVQRRVSDEDG
jgi:hypothetical protein